MMRSPGKILMWHIYRRAWWGFAAVATFVLIAVVLVQLVPRNWTLRFEPMGEVPVFGWFFGIACTFINIMLMSAFTMSDADVRNLTYARHLFVLPVRTRTLVAWPMLCGCTTVAAMWLLNAFFIFGQSGIVVPIVAPAAGFALLLATLQALSWTPFVQRWLHILLTVALLVSPIVVLLVLLRFDVQVRQSVVTSVLLGLTPIAYLAAVSGVAMARRGDAYQWRMWERIAGWIAKRRMVQVRPFRTAGRAQLWYEWRAHLIVLIAIGCILPCFLFLPAMNPHDVGLGWRLLGSILLMPLFFGVIAGGVLGHLTDPLSRNDGTFILVRPISSWAILRSKLAAALIMTGAIWAFVLAFGALLLARPGFAQSIGDVAAKFPTWKVVAIPLVALAILILFTWKSVAESLWINLSGRKWVEAANNFVFAGLVLTAIGAGLWLAFHPAWHRAALAAVPWLTGFLLAAKFIVACIVVRQLAVKHLVGPAAISLPIAMWFASLGLLGGTMWLVLPADYVETHDLLPGLAVLIPFSRLAGAPLSLEWNRHR